MQLTDEHLEEFQSIWKENFGTEINKDVALDKGLRLIRLMEIVAKHDTSESHDEITH